MFSDQITLPQESIIAGTNRNIVFYLYTEDMRRQIDATGMIARFSLTDYINPSDTPIFTKDCVIITPEGESLAIITATLNRSDTLNLCGKYIYQVTINDLGNVQVLKGIMNIANNFDKTNI